MSASHQPTMLTMKDITTTSLLSVALALVTSTASSACVNPGSIGSMEECVRFCQVDDISYGGGICQCLPWEKPGRPVEPIRRVHMPGRRRLPARALGRAATVNDDIDGLAPNRPGFHPVISYYVLF